MPFSFLTSIGVNNDISILWKKKNNIVRYTGQRIKKSDIVIKKYGRDTAKSFCCIGNENEIKSTL